MIKKIIAPILAAAIIACALPLTVFAEEAPAVRFAVTTDVHSRDETQLYVNYPENPMYFHARNSGNLYQEAYGILKNLLKNAEEEKLDFVLIAGDSADSGTKQQHFAVIDILKEFEENTGIPVYIVPGNHDYKNGTTPADIKEWYASFGYGEALTVDTETASYTADLPGDLRLIAVDSNKPDSDGDGMTDRLYSWIEQQAETAKKDGKTVIYMMHHTLLDPIPFAGVLMKDFIIRDHEAVAENFTKWGIRFVFTGHEHGNNITSYTGKNGQKVYDVLTTALTSYPLEYRQVTVANGCMSIENIAVTEVNRDCLVSGYTDEQLTLMEEDYTAYAYEYFKYSIQKKIMRYTQPEFLLEKLGTEEGVIADAVTTVMNNVNTALEMPLYDRDTNGMSVQTLAKKCGITLPESEYKSLIELASAIVAKVYYGNEDIPVEESPEGKLLIIGLNTMLKYILAESGNDAVRSFASALLANEEIAAKLDVFRWNRIYILLADNLYASVTATLAPVLDMFLLDDEIPDRDCVIPLAEDITQDNGLAAFLAKLKRFFEFFISVFKAYFSVGVTC